MPLSWPNKDPDDILDYGVDFTALINDPADVITSTTAVVAQGDVMIQSHTAAGQKTTTWLKGGTPGTPQSVRVHIVTQAGREVDQTVTQVIEQR